MGPARGVLLEPPLEGEGLEIGQHGVVGVLEGEGGEPGLGAVEVAVVDEVEGRPGPGVRGVRERSSRREGEGGRGEDRGGEESRAPAGRPPRSRPQEP